MMISEDHSKRNLTTWLGGLLFLTLALRLATAWVNYGFVALDDYSDILLSAVPAQSAPSSSEVIASSGIRSPIPRLSIHGLGQLAHWFGLSDPINQIRFIYSILGIWSMISVWLAWCFFRDSKQYVLGLYATAAVGLHFLMPYLSTRTLIESMSAPLLTACAYYAFRYDLFQKSKYLIAALCFLALASIFRFQVGVCVVILFALPLLHRRWRDLLMLGASGLLLLIATGLPDLWMRGAFHISLRSYIHYNINFSSTYGTTPFYSYALLLCALTIPPVLIRLYRHFNWSHTYTTLRAPLLIFFVFFLAHSLTPHKEERFVSPILPLFFVLLTPLLHEALKQTTSRMRMVYLVAVNSVLLVLISFSVAQYNAIGVIRFLRDHPQITKVLNVADSIVIFPRAYGIEKDQVSIAGVAIQNVQPDLVSDCNTAVVIREDVMKHIAALPSALEKRAHFAPGLAESAVIAMNPGNNIRRSQLNVFTLKGCM